MSKQARLAGVLATPALIAGLCLLLWRVPEVEGKRNTGAPGPDGSVSWDAERPLVAPRRRPERADRLQPLCWAVTCDRPDVVKRLIEAGANVDEPSGEAGYTALHVAAIVNDLRIAELLLDSGANVAAKSRRGTTPLHIAARHGRPGLICLLVVRGTEVNAHTASGRTALHYAADFDHPECVRLLLESGADPNAKDGGGMTPLDLAVSDGSAECVRVLREHLAADQQAD